MSVLTGVVAGGSIMLFFIAYHLDRIATALEQPSESDQESRIGDEITGQGSGTKEQPLRIKYTNWRGETAVREILPRRCYFSHNEWHKEDQWLMEAWDISKDELRIFAMSDMKILEP